MKPENFSLNDYQNEFMKMNASGNELFPGFSSRINRIIDMTDLSAPSKDYGRGAWLANLTQSSKSATSDWLKKDKPPKPSMLRKLIYFFCRHLPPVMRSPLFVECWVLYGDLSNHESSMINEQLDAFNNFFHEAQQIRTSSPENARITEEVEAL